MTGSPWHRSVTQSVLIPFEFIASRLGHLLRQITNTQYTRETEGAHRQHHYMTCAMPNDSTLSAQYASRRLACIGTNTRSHCSYSSSVYYTSYTRYRSSSRQLSCPTYAAPSSNSSLRDRVTSSQGCPCDSGSPSSSCSTSAVSGRMRRRGRHRDGRFCSTSWAKVSFMLLTLLAKPELCYVTLASTPTKLHLLCIDFTIIVLNMVLTTIAWETSLQAAMPTDTPDPLLPIPTSSTPDTTVVFSADEDDAHKPETPHESPYVIDLRIGHIYRRLRNPAPPPPEQELSPDDLLPLPNTTPWQLTNTLHILIRARARARQRARAEGDAQRERGGEERDSRTVPGGLDSTD